MQFTINSFRQLFPYKIFSLTFPWFLVKSPIFPWKLSNSLTFPGFQTTGHPVCIPNYKKLWIISSSEDQLLVWPCRSETHTDTGDKIFKNWFNNKVNKYKQFFLQILNSGIKIIKIQKTRCLNNFYVSLRPSIVLTLFRSKMNPQCPDRTVISQRWKQYICNTHIA